VQFGTSFELRPDVIPTTLLAVPGMAALPSTVDAFAARSRDSLLAQRGLSIDGPVRVAASNTLSFVARDTMGPLTDHHAAAAVQGDSGGTRMR